MSQKKDKISFNEVVQELEKIAPNRVTVLTFEGLRQQYLCGTLDWRYAASMHFQHVIHRHGTIAERIRLAKMRVGYWMTLEEILEEGSPSTPASGAFGLIN